MVRRTSQGRDATAIGTTTGIGAAIGAAAGGGTGAAIGAAAGAAAATIGVLARFAMRHYMDSSFYTGDTSG